MIPPAPAASVVPAFRAGPPDATPGPGGSAGDRSGFTLLELMIVTVLLGILAMIAFPVYQNVRADAVRSALRQQIRSLSQAQQMHFLEHDVYASDVSALDYRPAGKVELELRVGTGGTGPGGGGSPGAAEKGWTGRLTDPGFGVRCAVFHGEASPFAPAVVEGEIACDEEG